MDVRQFPAHRQHRVDPEAVVLKDDGHFPNNDRLPVLYYRRVLNLPPFDASLAVASHFNQHHWRGCWVSRIFTYPHYHSTAHEALGVVSGEARLRLGGEKGPVIGVLPGDLLVLPAGVAHECLEDGDEFSVVGAYPAGQRPDLCTGAPGERPGTDKNIDRVPLPTHDPFHGEAGPLQRFWPAKAP